jgi:hypothetical protein
LCFTVWAGSQQRDSIEEIAALTGLVPATIVSILLVTLQPLHAGAEFANGHGKRLVQASRAPLYFGLSTIAAGAVYFQIAERVVTTGELGTPFGGALTGSATGVGVVFVGFPYLAWLYRKRHRDFSSIRSHFVYKPRRPASVVEVLDTRSFSSAEATTGIGLTLACVGMFLPWYSASFSVAGAGPTYTFSSNGFGSLFGWLFFIAAVAAATLYVRRTLLGSAATVSAFSHRDARIYWVSTVLMLLMVLVYAVGGGSSGAILGTNAGLSFGWFVALGGAVAIAIGLTLQGSRAQVHPDPTSQPACAHPFNDQSALSGGNIDGPEQELASRGD